MSDPQAPLPWQMPLWLQVWTAFAEDHLAHALLLTGSRGVGKRHFVRALVGGLLCEAKPQAGHACGLCRSCLQLRAGTHPNLQWLKPEVDERSGKEKRDISIEQIRALSEKLSLASHYGQAKIGVIDPADSLNASGVNALLKTIEEPPAGTYLLLLTERPMALAATLRSRCQRLRFPVPDEKQAREWLAQEHPGVGEDALSQARGAPLLALALHESGALPLRARWREQMLQVAARRLDPVAAAAEVSKDVGKDKEQFPAWLEWLQGWLTELLRQRLSGSGNDAALASRVVGADLDQLLTEAVESQRRVRQNAPAQLTVESLMILWWRSTLERRRPA